MGLKWVMKYKKQPVKVYEGEELKKLAESMGWNVDLEKIAARKAEKEKAAKEAKEAKKAAEEESSKEESSK